MTIAANEMTSAGRVIRTYSSGGGAPVLVTRHELLAHANRYGVVVDCAWSCVGCTTASDLDDLMSEDRADEAASEHAEACRGHAALIYERRPDRRIRMQAVESTVPAEAPAPAPVAEAVSQLAEAVVELGVRLAAIEATVDAGLDRIGEEVGAAASALVSSAARPARRRWWGGGAR